MSQRASASAGREAARGLVFLLSPARCNGERALMLLDPRARSEIAQRVQSPSGVPLGELFSFLSALYFRGKLTYAQRFAQPVVDSPGVLVITPGEGLCAPSEAITAPRLRAMGEVAVDRSDARFTRALEADARVLAESIGEAGQVVLLGSIASSKYTEILLRVFASRLLFPSDFVGRGDMSRGGLLLRSTREDRELSYVPVQGAVLRGPRPPRLPRLPRSN